MIHSTIVSINLVYCRALILGVIEVRLFKLSSEFKRRTGAIIFVSTALFVTSCTQTDYSSLIPTPTVEETQEKNKHQLADYKAKFEAQQKAYKDAILKNAEAVEKANSAGNKTTEKVAKTG